MSDDLILRGVCVFPNEAISAEAIRLAQAASAEVSTQFCVNEHSALPHASLHQLALPLKDEPEFGELVEEVVGNHAPVCIEMQSVMDIFGRVMLFWLVRPTRQLWQLHSDLVLATEAVRDGYVSPNHADLLSQPGVITSAQRDSIGIWGQPLASPNNSGAPFCPHITLAATYDNDGALRAQEQLGDLPTLEFTASTAHITGIGDFGSCSESLASFPFDDS